MNDRELFELWFAEPMKRLEEIPSGGGGFIALAVSCFLFERYAVVVMKNKGEKGDTTGVIKQLQIEFGINDTAAMEFWRVIRNGILHEGMPLRDEKYASWGFHANYPAIALEIIDGKSYIKVQPWKFSHKVIELCRKNIDLLVNSKSFPWASIGDVPI